MISNLVDYTGPVVNVPPYYIYNPDLKEFYLPCGKCQIDTMLNSWDDLMTMPTTIAVIAMHRYNYAYILPVQNNLYGINILDLRIWMGQCPHCGTVYQTWKVQP